MEVRKCDGCGVYSDQDANPRPVSFAGEIDVDHLCSDCLAKVEEVLAS